MSNEDNGRQSNGPFNIKDHNSIFQIMDEIMNELNKTKKIFVFMFFSMMILPVTAIIIFMYTFDEPKVDRDELQANIQEFNTLSQKLKNQLITSENLQSHERENEIQSLLNSEEYNQTINRIDELSQNELELISIESNTKLYKNEFD